MSKRQCETLPSAVVAEGNERDIHDASAANNAAMSRDHGRADHCSPAEAIVRCLSRAAKYKDNETGNHILRLGEMAALIARAIGRPAEWVECIRLAAPMHDVGKIGVPDAILNKPGKLTEPERQVMMQHPVIGYEILQDEEPSTLLLMAADIALTHHERWDGAGYPAGLKGEEIPLCGRIVALCDVYDALRSSRCYKRAWTPERAQQFIISQAGRHFDPALVAVVSELFDSIEDILDRMADEQAQASGVQAGERGREGLRPALAEA